MTSNDITIQSYEMAVHEYVIGTPRVVSGSFKDWIDETLSLIPRSARIIEIGSGFGRDAEYIESFGFTVERTAGTAHFVEYLNQNGFVARQFNILTDTFSDSYDLVFANAVFLHFTPDELQKILVKSKAALKPNGILAFTVKKGEGEEWTSAKLGLPRYFCYWNPYRLQMLLKSTGYQIVELSEDERFLHIIVK